MYDCIDTTFWETICQFGKQIYGCRSWEWGKGLIIKRDTRELFEVMGQFSILIGVVVTQLNAFVQTHRTT